MNKKSVIIPEIDNYTVKEKLGSGTYATVYHAICKTTKIHTAIKCIEIKNITNIDRVVSEIKIMKILNHPNIVKLIDFKWDKRFVYIIMEYCNGGDLYKFITQKKKVPENIFRKFLRQLAVGMRYLNSNKICHYDLKPQNLLLVKTPKLYLKIGDFGFADLLLQDPDKNIKRGSPLYMAPEMILNSDQNEKVDLWSIGIISYECLLGMAPFARNTCEEIFKNVKTRVPIKIPNNTMSGSCKDLITKLLNYDPLQRLSMMEFFDHPYLDLEHYPDDVCYDKGLKLIYGAVKADSNKDFETAFYLYCDALRYFVPYCEEIEDLEKKQLLQNKISEYKTRAEVLLSVLRPDDAINWRQFSESKNNSVYQQLKILAGSTPNIGSGLELGIIAQLYAAEGNSKEALNKFKAALELLIPISEKEPSGQRKILLTKVIDDLLKQAEIIKALTTAQINEEHSTAGSENCILQ